MEKERRVKRNYIFTEKQLKEKLKMEGDITSMGLWKGRSPQMIEDGKITQEEHDCWFIETEDVELEEQEENE
ncbi:hypothetical protein LCGC14_2372010 [marine sediment metagenome]|uniref:Uncharacterized protein n=1 Tax=marine sediment metagenome TaxID=412755 RepID=A0A0F9CQS8_9ZZZZ